MTAQDKLPPSARYADDYAERIFKHFHPNLQPPPAGPLTVCLSQDTLAAYLEGAYLEGRRASLTDAAQQAAYLSVPLSAPTAQALAARAVRVCPNCEGEAEERKICPSCNAAPDGFPFSVVDLDTDETPSCYETQAEAIAAAQFDRLQHFEIWHQYRADGSSALVFYKN